MVALRFETKRVVFKLNMRPLQLTHAKTGALRFVTMVSRVGREVLIILLDKVHLTTVQRVTN